MEVTRLKLAELKKPEINIRKHPVKQINEYVRSIQMFGQIRPIVVDENYRIIAGNGLYEALTAANADEVDCYIVKGLSEVQKKKLMLADNKVYEMGILDLESFDQLISELEGDLDVPGYDVDLLEALTASAKETTESINSYGTLSSQQTEQMNRLAEKNEEKPQEQNTGYYTYNANATPNSHEYGVPVQQQPAVYPEMTAGTPAPHPEGGGDMSSVRSVVRRYGYKKDGGRSERPGGSKDQNQECVRERDKGLSVIFIWQGFTLHVLACL